MRRGKVYLVGAGPGDPRLLTVKGLEVLRRSDVVVYDRLVNPILLQEAPRRALRIFAGKQESAHSRPQEEINALLIDHARRGRRVVRLKGGDPFVFGRGGEEALALSRAGVSFELVPGVSAAVAVPALAGIPVTHRGIASSFAVVTGHEDTCKNGTAVDWAKLATAVDTIVVLMGLRALPRIIRQLLDHHRPPDTPVALIRSGSTAEQKTVTGTLADILERAAAARLQSPVTVVIGQVVGIRERVGSLAERGAGDAMLPLSWKDVVGTDTGRAGEENHDEDRDHRRGRHRIRGGRTPDEGRSRRDADRSMAGARAGDEAEGAQAERHVR
jgi:uroporphyrinogen III methyltransferase/synthase